MNKQNKIIKLMILLIIILLFVQLVSAEEVTIELSKGWSILPIPLNLESNDPSVVLEPILDDILIVRDYTNTGIKVYDPNIPFRFNTLQTIESGKAYQIKMSQKKTVTLTGTPIPHKRRKINLHETWNCMPYLGEYPMSISEILGEDILNKITIIREYTKEGVKIFDPKVPERFNTLQTFEPGKGYQIKAKQDVEIDFSKTFPNVKDTEKYSNKQVFLISDNDWKQILPLVSLSIWKNNGEICQKSEELDQEICVYPTLIYHEEKKEFTPDISTISSEILKPIQKEVIVSEKTYDDIYFNICNSNTLCLLSEINKIKEIKLNFLSEFVNVGQTLRSEVTINNEFPFEIEVDKIKIKLPKKYKEYFREAELSKESISVEANSNTKVYFDFEFIKEIPSGQDITGSIDLDSTIHFMQQYSPNKVTIMATEFEKNCGDGNDNDGDFAIDNEDTDCQLKKLLNTRPELGLGLSENKIELDNPDNYLSYWANYNDVIYVEDNYNIALLASTYASLINAPLIIKGTDLDNDETFKGKNIICVGNVNKNCKKEFSSEELQKEYIKLTKTDKVVLINPNDLNFKTESESEKILKKTLIPFKEVFSGFSLASPFFASAKKGLIIPIDTQEAPKNDNYEESSELTELVNNVNNLVENKINNLFESLPKYLIIIASNRAIPDSVYKKLGGANARNNKDIEYANINGNQLEVGRINSVTISDVSSYVYRSIFYRDLLNKIYNKREYTGLFIGHSFIKPTEQTKTMALRTSNSGYDSTCFAVGASEQIKPAIYENIIVWQDNRYGNKDIYMYDLEQERELRITNNDAYQGLPDIDGNTIVWQDLRNGDYDIYMYNINTKKEIQITDNNLADMNPRIHNNKIVWQVCNKGHSIMSCSGSNIWIYDINTKEKRKITNYNEVRGKGNSIPNIYENLIAYKHDVYPNSNLKIYDLNNNEEIFSGDYTNIYNIEVHGNKVTFRVWYNKHNHIFMYDIETRTTTQISENWNAGNSASIYDDTIIYVAYDSNSEEDKFPIIIHDLKSNNEKILNDELFSNFGKEYFRIYKDKITFSGAKKSKKIMLFMGSAAERNVFIYDLSTKESKMFDDKNTICTEETKPPFEDYKKKQSIFYSDHGNSQSWMNTLDYYEIPFLDVPYIHALACSTNNAWISKEKTFGLNLIRRGAIAYQAPQGTSYVTLSPCQKEAIQKLTQNEDISIGNLHNYIMDLNCEERKDHYGLYKKHHTTLGDPTIKPIFKEVDWS